MRRKFIIIFTSLMLLFAPSLVSASSLQDQINALNAEIAKNKATLESIEGQANTLQAHVDGLNAEVRALENQIELANLQIQQTAEKITDTVTKLEKQKRIMYENARVLYKQGDPSAIEILASSDNFSQFVDKQEYLEKVKETVNKAARDFIALKGDLEKQQKDLQDFAAQQQAQRDLIAIKRNDQANLLAQTRGEESKYQELVKSLEAQRVAAENQLNSELAAYLNGSGSFVSQGQVSRGDRIGSVGSTGYSFGPHLHFALYSGGSYVNPHAGGTSIINGFSWPVPSITTVSQPYGCQSEIVYAQSCGGGSWLHSGMDIGNGSSGNAVVAVGDGDIIARGDYGDGYGFKVIIDHHNGYLSIYGHMIPQ